MRNWQIVTFLLLCLVLVGATACNPLGQNKPQVTQELVEVKRGNLTVTVSGSGNIEVANEMKLTFGVGGRVDKIYVEENDKVREGDVPAELETDALELAVTQAQVAQSQAQVAVTQAEVAVTQAKVAVTQAQVAVTQAQVALLTAMYNLEEAQDLYTLSDIKVAQADVDTARRDLDEALWKWSKYDPGTPGWEDYQKVVIHAQSRLNAAEDRLDAMLSGFDTEEVAIKKLQVEIAKQSLEQARQSLELTQQSLKLAEQSLELEQQSLELAQQSLKHAQKQLDEATLTAPFDGIIASVYVDEGDTILATTTIIHLIDLTSMELKVEVDEIDIIDVKLGQRAIIEMDALPALQLEGKVSFISLLPKTQAGIITYTITITLNAPEVYGIKIGMSATADIIINERSNILLVPNRAITQDSQGNEIVEVMVNEQIQQRSVVTGISDGFETEIIDGLREGETVVIEIKARPSGSGLF